MAERPDITNAVPVENPRAKVDWPYVVEQVRAAKGEWVRSGPFSAHAGWRIRKGDNPHVDPDEFEVTMRRDHTSPTGRYFLFMRVK